MEINFELMRRKYKPDSIKYVIVAEAPPDLKDKDKEPRFFYKEDVAVYDYLFLSIMKVLYKRDAELYENTRSFDKKEERIKKKTSLLERFKKDGFYLMDLYPMPKELKPKGCGATFYSKEFIKRLKYEKSITKDTKFIILNPAKKLQKELVVNGYNVSSIILPFPLYKGKKAFLDKFEKALKDTAYKIA